MKLAVALAILKNKPCDISTEVYVVNLASSWENRNLKNDKYIRWLELERLQLMHDAAINKADSAQKSSEECEMESSQTIPTFNIDSSFMSFLDSIVKFLQIPQKAIHNYDELLSATTLDLINNVREIMKDQDLFLGTFAKLLEGCCESYRHAKICSSTSDNLLQLCELICDFVIKLTSNSLLDQDSDKIMSRVEEIADKEDLEIEVNPFSFKPSQEDNEIKFKCSARTQKQLLVHCIVHLSGNPDLKTKIQTLLINKVVEICENLDGMMIIRKPAVLESMYYLVEGLYCSGDVVSSDVIRSVKKCIDLTILKFPIAARFLLLCCAGKLEQCQN